MSLLRPPVGWAIRLSMMGAAAISVVAPAFADKPVQFSFKEAADYARITAKWGDGDETAWFVRDKRGRVTAMHFGSARAWDFVSVRVR